MAHARLPHARLRPSLLALASLASLASLAVAGACAPPLVIPSLPVARFERDTITIDTPRLAAYVGRSIQLTATTWRAGLDTAANADRLHAEGMPLVRWESTFGHVGWVSDDGVLTLDRPGTIEITARGPGVVTTRMIEVRANPVTAVEFASAAPLRAEVGQAVSVEARATDGGSPVADAPVDYAIAGRGLRAGAARVSDRGEFVASAPGVYTVIAECNGHADTRVVVVGGGDAVPVTSAADVRLDSPGERAFAGTSLRYVARVATEGGEAREAPVRWISSDTSVAVPGPDGLVVFLHAGRVTITATAGERQAHESFQVWGNPAARVTMTAGGVTADGAADVRVGDRVRFREDVWQRGGSLVKGIRVNYAVVPRGDSPADGAEIGDDRAFVARAPGVYTVIAQVGAVSDHQTFVVRARDGAGDAARR